jgi:RNA polymerase sigma-70 factor (ECF subfamily)
MPESSNSRQAWLLAAVSQYEQRLVRFATALVRDEQAARDVVQHAFLELCRRSPADIGGHLAQWLFTACRNKAIDVLRQRRRTVSFPDNAAGDLFDGGLSPDELCEQADLGRKLLSLVDRLPDSQRECVLLWLEGWTGGEIGDITGRTHGTVRVHLHKAFTSLRQHPDVRRLMSDEELIIPSPGRGGSK